MVLTSPMMGLLVIRLPTTTRTSRSIMSRFQLSTTVRMVSASAGLAITRSRSTTSTSTHKAPDADGVRSVTGFNNLTIQNSTFNNVFDDVLTLTNATNLSGTGNRATNFNGMLLNDGGGNSGTISFDFVDPDGDGTGAAMTLP